MQMGPRGAMPAIPGVMQAQPGPPGPMTALLQQEGPPPGLHPASGPIATPAASEVDSCSGLPAHLCGQQCICTIAAGGLPHCEANVIAQNQGTSMQRLSAADRREDVNPQEPR